MCAEKKEAGNQDDQHERRFPLGIKLVNSELRLQATDAQRTYDSIVSKNMLAIFLIVY